ncbi:MAG: T9SS type A sorting domain-containing protein, partial [Ekhidna sp.]
QFTGFVNGEGETDLNASISISTTASGVEGQPSAGSYPISLTVSASEAGDNYTFTINDATLTINMIDQVISVTEIDNKEPTDAAFDVVATVDSGLDLTYEVSGPATISGTTITLDGTEGMVTVTVLQVGDINHNAATATVSFEVALALGLNDGLAEAIKIYPNPVTEYIMIDTNELVDLRFYGLNGQLIKEYVQVNGRVDVSSMQMGTYLMQVSNSEEQITLKINKSN